MGWSSVILFSLYFNCLSAVQNSVCNNYRTCGACISNPIESCFWCAQDNKTSEERCLPINNLNDDKLCDPNMVYKTPEPVQNASRDEFSSALQFIPRHINIKLSPGVPVKFNMSYRPAKDFPLDLYFLLDYSFTMKTLKTLLEEKVNKIYDELKKISKNVRLGVGSFIDKPSFPLTDKKNYITYSFKNHLNLTEDMDMFQKVLHNAEFGANYDDPEGGLDALMQVMICNRTIGWRDEARKIILLATDSSYHSAGEGKYVGAYHWNDEKCHVVKNEYVTEDALKYDYPSLNQINKIATNYSYKIIFAIKTDDESVKTDYINLAKHIKNAKYVEMNEESNIVQILKEIYEESLRTVKLNNNYESDELIKLDLDQSCEGLKKVNCESTPTNPEVHIPATIEVKSTKYCNKNITLTIKPHGLNDHVKLNLEVDCSCSCEQNTNRSEKCNSFGSLQCGVCVCDETKSGDYCELNCSANEAIAYSEACKETDDINLCNNHGDCRCGVCKCNEDFSGVYCQYNDKSCLQKNGRLCAGHGICKYGQCNCDSGWSGDDCSCPLSESGCIGPFSSKACSGRGKCSCGECTCDNVDGRSYSGVFCDACQECTAERCKDLEDYAYCNHEKTYQECNKEYNQTSEIKVELLNKTETESPKWGAAYKCVKTLPDGQMFVFKYQILEDHTLRLLIQKEFEPHSYTSVWVAVGSAVAAVILIGILTLIAWKILIDIYDKREYDKFCAGAKAEGYDTTTENPFYKNPNLNFVNPTWTGEEDE